MTPLLIPEQPVITSLALTSVTTVLPAAPSQSLQIVTGIFIANTSGSAVTVTLNVNNGTTDFPFYRKVVAANDTLFTAQDFAPLTLREGYSLTAQASVGAAAVVTVISGTVSRNT